MPSNPKGLHLELVGADKVQAAFDRLDLFSRQAAIKIVNKHSLDLMNYAKISCPVDMGQLRASIKPIFYSGGMTAEVHTTAGYGAFVEFGTGPLGSSSYRGPLPDGYVHGPGNFFPPLQVIKDWCRRHHIDPRLAFVIARKIGKHGSKARPFMFPAFEVVRPDFLKELQDLVPDAARRL